MVYRNLTPDCPWRRAQEYWARSGRSGGVVSNLGDAGVAGLEALIVDGSAGSLLAILKADPGPAGLESLLSEVEKLSAAQALACVLVCALKD